MAHSELEKINNFWMDLSPEYIFYDQDMNNGKLKFKFMLLDLVYQDHFLKTKINKIQKNEFPFIHIELFENLIQGNTNLEIRYFKENTYSLGLIILSLAMKFDFTSLYYDLMPFDREGISKQKAQISNGSVMISKLKIFQEISMP